MGRIHHERLAGEIWSAGAGGADAGAGVHPRREIGAGAEQLSPPVEPPRSPYKSTVAAAGLVEARSENIAVGAALPGVVLEVYVPSSEVGRFVKQGTPLFRVDERHLRAQLKYQQ